MEPAQKNPQPPAQSLVEFALTAPLLLMLLFGIIELGILLSVYIGMTNTAREASRAGAIYQYSGSTVGLVTDTVDLQREAYISSVISETLHPIVDPAAVSVTVTYTPTMVLDPGVLNLYRAGDTIGVQLVYTHTLFFGFLGPQTLTIRTHSAMRIETGGTD
ncbi:MAG TPA: TadE family protein [Roseiflexaceae bacterium]|nr:TadE family protein [Roseiflexaceae bacterium]